MNGALRATCSSTWTRRTSNAIALTIGFTIRSLPIREERVLAERFRLYAGEWSDRRPAKSERPGRSHGELETSATYRYTSDQRGELEPYAIQPATGLFDGSLTWVSPGRKYEIALWGKNLANRVWISHVYTIANEVFGVYGDPRMYGARLTWHFAP